MNRFFYLLLPYKRKNEIESLIQAKSSYTLLKKYPYVNRLNMIISGF